jgi:hypothetical protein
MKLDRYLLTFLLAAVSLPLAAQDYEEPPILKASDFLENEFLKSEHHEVAPEVGTGGLLNHYKVNSSIGPFEVLGTEMVKVRVREIHAIEKLRKRRAPGAAAKGLGQQLKFEAEVLGKVITKPVQSAVAIPQGIGSFVKRSGSSAKNQAQVGGNYTGGPMRDWFQIAEFKLEWANKLGVNPYTDNEVLQKHLERVSSSTVAGGLGLRILIPGDGLIVAADEGRKAKELQEVFLTPPTKLFGENRAALLELGVSTDLADRFLGSSFYNPASQAFLVRALATMPEAESPDLFIEEAIQADSLLDTLFFQRSAQMLAWYHSDVEKITEHRKTDTGFPVAISANNDLVVPLYFDYASWSKEAAGFARSFLEFSRKAGTRKVVVVSPGRFSSRAEKELASLGYVSVKPSL